MAASRVHDRRGRHRKYLPWMFTEHGAVMAANVLRSPKAVAMSVYVVRAFVRMREELMTSAVIFKRLAEIDKKLVTHDVILRDIYVELRRLEGVFLIPEADQVRGSLRFFHGAWGGVEGWLLRRAVF